MPIRSINPATGELLQELAPHSAAEVDRRLGRAAAQVSVHRQTSFEERAELLRACAGVLDREQERLARLITTEMGKPVVASRAEVAKCAMVCRYYAEHGAAHLAPEKIATSASESYVCYQPLGVVLAVMPWNFPFWQVFRFAAPAVMAGNVALLKHASNVPQCALAIESIFREAGAPEALFQALLIGGSDVAEVIADRRVAAATLTGSEAAGSSLATAAGKVIKKVVLELGGSDPFIVMPSADLDEAVKIAVKARTVNSGQSCIAAKRFIVHREIAEEFRQRFVAAMESLVVGDPQEEATEIGPMATEQIAADLAKQVDGSVARGARLLTGGRRIDGKGFYFQPTVLDSIPDDAPAACEELFGPVASLFVAGSLDDAIARANDTQFGLGASAWTRDAEEEHRLTSRIEAGQVFINAMVASDPRMPFGGIKRSGYGRELGEQGIREFTNVKTVWIQRSVGARAPEQAE